MQCTVKTLLLVASILIAQVGASNFYKPVVHFVDGRSEVRLEEQMKWTNLAQGESIQHNSTLQTSDNSELQVKFQQGWYFILKSRSHLQYLYSRGDQLDQFSFSSLQGELFFDVDRCPDCFNSSISWYFGDMVVNANQAAFAVQTSGQAKHLSLYRGALVVRIGSEVKLLKAPAKLSMNQGRLVLERVSRLDNPYQLHQTQVEKVQTREVISHLRPSLSFKSQVSSEVKKLKWDVPKFIHKWNQEFLDSAGVALLEAEPTLSQSQLAHHLVHMDIQDFTLNSSQTNWSLRVQIEFKILSPHSRAVEDQWVFSKLYQGKVDSQGDLRLLRYLPLDNNNQKIKQSFFDDLWYDYQVECLLRLADPLYQKPGELF